MPEAGQEEASRGVWHLFTETGSHYEVDFDAMTVRRNSGTGELRRDGEALRLLSLGDLSIGAPAEMMLEVSRDGFATLRVTSHVTALVPATSAARLCQKTSGVGSDPTVDDPDYWKRCYYAGCPSESTFLLHLRAEPDGYADLCLQHAALLARASRLVEACDCAFCRRAAVASSSRTDREIQATPRLRTWRDGPRVPGGSTNANPIGKPNGIGENG